MPGLRGVHRVAGDLATSRFPPLDSSVLSMPPPDERRKNDVRDHRRERRRDCDEGECRIVESHRQLVGPGEAREGDTAQYDGEGNHAKPNGENPGRVVERLYMVTIRSSRNHLETHLTAEALFFVERIQMPRHSVRPGNDDAEDDRQGDEEGCPSPNSVGPSRETKENG